MKVCPKPKEVIMDLEATLHPYKFRLIEENAKEIIVVGNDGIGDNTMKLKKVDLSYWTKAGDNYWSKQDYEFMEVSQRDEL